MAIISVAQTVSLRRKLNSLRYTMISSDAMPEFDITRKSRPVVVTPYQPHWVDEFTQIARHIRDLVGHAAIRIDHMFNQRYALLFRDYLRSSEEVRAEYELLKRRAAQLFPDSIDGYLFLKDPVLHIIYEGASLWAEKVRWSPDEDYI